MLSKSVKSDKSYISNLNCNIPFSPSIELKCCICSHSKSFEIKVTILFHKFVYFFLVIALLKLCICFLTIIKSYKSLVIIKQNYWHRNCPYISHLLPVYILQSNYTCQERQLKAEEFYAFVASDMQCQVEIQCIASTIDDRFYNKKKIKPWQRFDMIVSLCYHRLNRSVYEK